MRAFLVLSRSARWVLLASVVAGVSLAILTYTVMKRSERSRTLAIGNAVSMLVRDEAISSKAYNISQAIEDLQAIGTLVCARISRVHSGETYRFYDSTSRSGCLEDEMISIDQVGVDGNKWIFELQTTADRSVLLARFLLPMLIVGLGVVIGVTAARRLSAEALRLAEAKRGRELIEQLNRQVGHDIAAPIFALKTLVEISGVPEQTRVFIRQIIERIEGIGRTLKGTNPSSCVTDVFERVGQIVEQIKVSHKADVVLRCQSSDFRCLVNTVEFDRAISNILINSIEASAKQIGIDLRSDGSGDVIIDVSDDGEPFPPEVIKNFGRVGGTVGKAGGSGLGLSHAKKLFESVGGSLRLASEVPKIVQIRIPSSRQK